MNGLGSNNNKVRNLFDARSGVSNLGNKVNLSLTEGFAVSGRHYNTYPSVISVGDEVWMFWFNSVSSTNEDARLYVSISKDNGNTWGDIQLITTFTGEKVYRLTGYFNHQTNSINLAYQNINVSSGISTMEAGYIEANTPTVFIQSPVTQPYTHTEFHGNIYQINRYIYSVASGYDSGTRLHPAIMISTDGGVNWVVQQTLPSFNGKAVAFFNLQDGTSSSGRLDEFRIIMGDEDDFDAPSSVLYSNSSFTDFKELLLPFPITSGSVAYIGGEFALSFDAKNNVGYQHLITYSKNGIDWEIPKKLTGYRTVYPSLAVLKNGDLTCAYFNESDLTTRKHIYIQPVRRIKSELLPNKSLIPRFTDITTGSNFVTRKIIGSGFYELQIVSDSEFSTSEIEIRREDHFGGGLASVVSEVVKENVISKKHSIVVKIDGIVSFYFINANPNSSIRISVDALKIDTPKTESELINDKSLISRVRNLTKEAGLDKLSTPSLQFLGWGGVTIGRNDEMVLIYSEVSDHGAATGNKLKLSISYNYGKTWTTPIVMVDFTSLNRQPIVFNMFYDESSDLYYLNGNTWNVGQTATQGYLAYNSGNILTPGDWNQVTITNNLTDSLAMPHPPKRIGAGKLWIPAYGKDTGDLEFKPVIIESTDGLTFDVKERLDTVTGNENQIITKSDKDRLNTYLMLARNNDGNTILVKSDDEFATFTQRELEYNNAGGAIIFENNGYFAMISRLIHSSFDSMGYIQYSLDGEAWSNPEPLNIPYPVQPRITKSKTGRVFASGCMQPNRDNDLGYVWMTELNLPTFEEVNEKTKGSVIEAFPRYTTISAGSSFSTDTYNLNKFGIVVKIQTGSFPSGVKVYLDGYWSFVVGDYIREDITDKLTISSNSIVGSIEASGNWSRLTIENPDVSDFSVKGYISLM